MSLDSATLSLPLSFGQSVQGYQWKSVAVEERTLLHYQQYLGLPEIVSRLLISRNIALNEVDNFFNPTLKSFLPDPYHLRDMEKAAHKLADAVEQGVKITVFGDYDVDGATSAALLKRFFAMLGTDIRIYIPDRIEEGYGPNEAAFQYLQAQGTQLIITVDCGTASFAPLKLAQSLGVEVIVVDHHLSSDILPPAYAIINPNRLDETSSHRNLAAVGVSFLLVVALNRILRERGFYRHMPPPNLLSLLDLVALGTVCDVMSLTGLNRVYVAQGLKILAQRHNIGLKALADIVGLEEKPTVYHLGFIFGPRINAGGRIGKADLGARLLTTENYEEARSIAEQLDQLNAERQTLESLILEEAMLQASEQGGTEQIMITVTSQTWHPGVIGIVAGRLKDHFNRPTAVISFKDGIGKASARSISGVDLGQAILAAKEQGHLEAGGGHAMAAGFTICESNLVSFSQFMHRFLHESVTQYGAFKQLPIIATVHAQSITTSLVAQIAKLEPFGVGNPEPRFVILEAVILKADLIGKDHVRILFTDTREAASRKGIKGVAFRCSSTPLGQTLLHSVGKKLHIAGRLKINHWNGTENVEILIDDVALC